MNARFNMQIENFYLGTHVVHWLEFAEFPLFISNRQLRKRRTLRPAKSKWCLDSGGFSELNLFGKWTIPDWEYVADVRRYTEYVGSLEWAAIKDWMCEPIVRARTGLSVIEHQKRTVQSFLDLKSLAPDLPFIPILQGWIKDDYLRHMDLYFRAGVKLQDYPTVGLGSVCRRQNTKEIHDIVRVLWAWGIKLHGFGVKVQGLKQVSQFLQSADSLAWSFAGRNDAPLPGHTHKNCANCLDYAMLWREKLVNGVLENKRGFM